MRRAQELTRNAISSSPSLFAGGWPGAGFRWPPNATGRGSSLSTGDETEFDEIADLCCMTTSARRWRRSSRTDSFFKSYSQVTHTRMRKRI